MCWKASLGFSAPGLPIRLCPTNILARPPCWPQQNELEEQNLWLLIGKTFLLELDAHGTLNWQEAVIDGSFAWAKPGAHASRKSDPLRIRLGFRGIHLIAPHRRNRKYADQAQDRVLQRYTRRWKVERTFSGHAHFRRLVVQYESLVTV